MSLQLEKFVALQKGAAAQLQHKHDGRTVDAQPGSADYLERTSTSLFLPLVLAHT